MNRRPDSRTVKARKAEIRRRYARGRPRFSWIGRRVVDLEAFYSDTYGQQLPDNDNGRDLVRIMAHHLAQTFDDPRHSLPQALERWAPWLSIVDARELVADAIAKPRRWKADRLAWRLKLDDATRTRLGITTIGSVDVDAAERKRRREARKYQRKVARRRAQGATTRAEYLAASVSRARPWMELGMSRAAWYRAGKPATRP
jgi:hypothetical protein